MVHYHSQMYATAHGERPPVHTVASLFQTVCYDNKDQLSAGIIVAGWDEHEGGQVYNVPLGGGIFRQPWSIGGASRWIECDIGRLICCRRTTFRFGIYLCVRIL